MMGWGEGPKGGFQISQWPSRFQLKNEQVFQWIYNSAIASLKGFQGTDFNSLNTTLKTKNTVFPFLNKRVTKGTWIGSSSSHWPDTRRSPYSPIHHAATCTKGCCQKKVTVGQRFLSFKGLIQIIGHPTIKVTTEAPLRVTVIRTYQKNKGNFLP